MKEGTNLSKLSIEIGQRIRNYRSQHRLSQEELAEKCGLHPTYIGQVERGEKNATLESISKITAGLSISLSTLFENIEDYHDEQSNNYPAMAYGLVQSVSKPVQEKLIAIIKIVIKINHN